MHMDTTHNSGVKFRTLLQYRLAQKKMLLYEIQRKLLKKYRNDGGWTSAAR